MAPPIPVPTKIPAISWTPEPAPRACSPRTPAFTSLSTTTGTPRRALSCWPSGTSFQPKFGARSTTPCQSMVPGAPTLTARRSDRVSLAAWTALSTSAATPATSRVAFCDGFVGILSSARTLSFPSTTSARRLVPPISTPTMISLRFRIGDPELSEKSGSDSLSHPSLTEHHLLKLNLQISQVDLLSLSGQGTSAAEQSCTGREG